MKASVPGSMTSRTEMKVVIFAFLPRINCSLSVGNNGRVRGERCVCIGIP